MTSYHIVGIGGAGMSAIARVLLARGHRVSGSDAGAWPLAEALARDGAAVHVAFDAAHVAGAEVVIRSSAYHEDNVEVRAALERGIPLWKRDDAWRELTRGQRVVAIAGTHGKSTTSAMTWTALRAGGVDASLICGAVLRDLGTNAHAGSADVFVIEADEYDNAFLALTPEIAVVTTCDHDHVDLFPTTESYRDAFRSFVRRLAPDGVLIASADDPGARELASWAALGAARTVTYGADASSTSRLSQVGERSYALGEPPLRFSLALPGRHNALNAAGALLAAGRAGASLAGAAAGLAAFAGVGRRLEPLGAAHDVRVIDDYAHHPREIAVGLDTYGDDVVVVFQPHTPTRLAAFFDDFVRVLRRPRAVVVVETFRSAREQADPHGRARALADAVRGRYAVDAESAARAAADLVRPGDTVLVMGAGDVRPVGERLLELLGAPV